jgi:hypothetical protein
MSRKKKTLSTSLPLNFLLGCSDRSLGNFELAKLTEVAELRKELHSILDRLIDQMAQAALSAWFRTTDRDALQDALQNSDDVITIAQEHIRTGQRDDEELVPLTSLPPGAAHLAAALRYQERNLTKGLCAICPKPLDRNSVRYCTEHLSKSRSKARQKKGLLDVGSREYLYGGELPESTHGRTPGTLQSLAISRDKKTRAVLAQLGLPAGSTATALQAAKAALLEHMPSSENTAMMPWELFDKAGITDSLVSTTKIALKQLFDAGQVQRIGLGIRGNPYLYLRGRGLRACKTRN